MDKHKRKKLRLNIKFINGSVVCAKSPGLCKECKEIQGCETITTYYYPFQGIEECFRNNERRK
jgi:hypothetical protein